MSQPGEALNSQADRARGALLGLFIGDALAMPVHWYYDRRQLFQDYGEVVDYLDPKNPHPGSILWRSRYVARNPLGEILHDQARYWGQKNVHYHQFLQAGQNTLNLQLCRGWLDQLTESQYEPQRSLDFYVDFLNQPGRHRDTYIEECHRNFFANRATGLALDRCGAPEHHLGGLPQLVPILIAERARMGDQAALRSALKHMAVTHPGPEMELAGEQFGRVLLAALNGVDLKQTLLEQISRREHACWRFPYLDWLGLDDLRAIGPGGFSPACYVDQALPATFYLALKYADRPEAGLVANTNAGGDNAHRGALLGALLGAANVHWPQRWVEGLEARASVKRFHASRLA